MSTIQVCVGSACHMKGSYNVINDLQRIISARGYGDKIAVKAVLCLGKCTGGVSVRIDDGEVLSVTQGNLVEFFDKHVANNQ